MVCVVVAAPPMLVNLKLPESSMALKEPGDVDKNGVDVENVGVDGRS